MIYTIIYLYEELVPSHVDVFREGDDGHASVADDGAEHQLALHFVQVVDVPGQEQRAAQKKRGVNTNIAATKPR